MPAIVIATCLLTQTSGLNSAISAAAKKLDSMKSFTVKVEVATTSGRNSYRSQFDIRFHRPDALLMRIREPQQGGKAATDRSYLFNGTKLTAIDSIAKEHLSRGVSVRDPMYLRVSTVLGRLGEAFEASISGERTKFILTGLAQGLKWTRRGDVWESSGPDGLISIKFERGLVRSIAIVSKERTSRWTFDYGTSTMAPRLTPPSGYRRVQSFLERPSEPRFASAQARRLYQKAFLAYQNLGKVDLVTTLDRGEKIHIRYSGKSAREDWPAYSWTYDGANLTIVDYYRKVVYRGKARGSQVIEMLANAGCPMHPFTRTAFRKQNWLSTILTDDMMIDKTGAVNLGTVPHEIMSFKASSFKGSMLIDPRTGRASQLTIKHLSRTGSVISTSDTTYRFKSVGRAIPAATFKLASPKGFVLKPVGQLADKIGGVGS